MQPAKARLINAVNFIYDNVVESTLSNDKLLELLTVLLKSSLYHSLSDKDKQDINHFIYKWYQNIGGYLVVTYDHGKQIISWSKNKSYFSEIEEESSTRELLKGFVETGIL